MAPCRDTPGYTDSSGHTSGPSRFCLVLLGKAGSLRAGCCGSCCCWSHMCDAVRIKVYVFLCWLAMRIIGWLSGAWCALLLAVAGQAAVRNGEGEGRDTRGRRGCWANKQARDVLAAWGVGGLFDARTAGGGSPARRHRAAACSRQCINVVRTVGRVGVCVVAACDLICGTAGPRPGLTKLSTNSKLNTQILLAAFDQPT